MALGGKYQFNRLWFTLPVLGLVIVAVLFLYSSKNRATEVTPKRRSLTEAIYALGKVKSDTRYEVKTGVLTILKTLSVREGQIVKKGQSLLQFEDSNVFSSPFDGIVTKINYYPGEIVVPQTVVLRVENTMRRYIEVSLEQQGALRAKSGQKAKVDFEEIRSNPIEGKVVTVFSRDDEFIAHIDLPDLPPSVLPGMTADVVIETGTKENALVIPVGSVHQGQVTLIRSGKQVKVGLEIGIIDGEWAEVLSGDIQETDLILVRQSKPGDT